MGIITTYVCDVSGKQGKKEEFVEVRINSTNYGSQYNQNYALVKMIHLDVALKLNLVVMKKEQQEANPELTIESKLMALLKEYVDDIAYEAADNAVSNSRN